MRITRASLSRKGFAAVRCGSLAAVAGALLLSSCGSGDGEDRPGVEVIGGEGSVSVSGAVEGYGQPLYEPATDQTLNLAIGLDLKDIRALMAGAASGSAVDWGAVRTIFEDGKNQVMPDGSLRTLAGLSAIAPAEAFPDAAAVYGSTDFLAGIIRDGIDGAGRAAGLRDNSRRQLVDKGIQAVMYGKAIAHLAAAEAAVPGPAAGAEIDAAWATLAGERDSTGTPNNGLLATGLGREDDFSLHGRISRPLEASLYSALVASGSGDAAEFESELAAGRSYLNTIFYLSTLRSARVAQADARAQDREAHLAEGWAFFQAIRAQVAAVSPTSASAVEQAFLRPAGERFPAEATAAVFGALNAPEVLAAMTIPAEFVVDAP